jgi:ABC-type dipeptide/oligopeptide/nickel transport system permease subunit
MPVLAAEALQRLVRMQLAIPAMRAALVFLILIKPGLLKLMAAAAAVVVTAAELLVVQAEAVAAALVDRAARLVRPEPRTRAAVAAAAVTPTPVVPSTPVAMEA